MGDANNERLNGYEERGSLQSIYATVVNRTRYATFTGWAGATQEPTFSGRQNAETSVVNERRFVGFWNTLPMIPMAASMDADSTA